MCDRNTPFDGMEGDVVRVLFTCIGGPGHLNPLLPIFQAITDVGHTVLWATSGSLVAARIVKMPNSMRWKLARRSIGW